MTEKRKAVFRAIAAVIGALVLTKIFYRWPDLFPSSLRSLGNTLVSFSGSQSAESSSDIELAFVLFASLIICGLLVAVVTWAYHWFAHRNDA